MSDDKRAERTRALARRVAAFARHGRAAGERLARHGLEFVAPVPGSIVSGFSAIRDEIDPAALLARLASEGHRLALPVLQGKGQPLLFRQWSPGDETAVRHLGHRRAASRSSRARAGRGPRAAAGVRRCGYRLGYGGGFYDRTLARLRALKPVVAVGIGYDELKIDAVPHLDYDQRLDWVLTPSGPLRCGEE